MRISSAGVKGWMAAAWVLAASLPLMAQVAVVPSNPNPPVKVNTKVKHVLLNNYTLGGHDQTFMLDVLTRLATKYGFQLDVSDTRTYITPSTLEGVDVAVFNNGEGDVLSDSTSLGAMKNLIQVKGKGLLQEHGAASYIPCPTSGREDLTDPDCRWLARILVRQYRSQVAYNTEVRVIADSVKQGEVPPNADADAPAATMNHGRSNPESRMIFEALPPNGLGINPAQKYSWDSLADQWFNFIASPRLQDSQQVFDGVTFSPVNVLFSLDVDSSKTPGLRTGDHPCAWGRKVGAGLTAFNSFGHWDYLRPRGASTAHPVKDSLEEKVTWNLLRYLARDFMGCMDNRYQEYNPEASVTTLTSIDDPSPCKTPANTRLQPLSGKQENRFKVDGKSVVVPLYENGDYRVRILSMDGKALASASGRGGDGRLLSLPAPQAKSYVVRIEAPRSGLSSTSVLTP